MSVEIYATLGEPHEVAATLSDLRYLVFQGMKGDTGDSAYEEAVSLGFVGTEAEWIASLKGEKGDTGFSPEIRVTDITGGHRLDIYNELGYETVDVMDGIDGEDGEDGVSPAVAVTDIAGGHRVTITDATHPHGQSFAVMNGSGIPEDVKVALLDCFENVAWINDDGQTYYNALYAALYPPKTLVSISAVFNQGSAVIYDTDSLDTLKQYLTVTATYDDTSTGVVTNYTLSGTLTEGTSTITVLYGGKTTTFNVAVTSFLPSEYQLVEWIGSTGEGQCINTGITNTDGMTTVTDAQYTNADAYDFNYQLIGIQTEYSGLYVAILKGTSWGFGIAGTAKFNTTKAKVTQRFQISNTWNALAPSSTFDGETISFTRSSAASDTLQLRLFSPNVTNVHSAIARIFNVKTYDTNNSLISDLYPCYRKSDGVIGVYDTVRNAFYANDGTGTFTKGDDV